ncbi:MAG TPA: ABC transporter substrate-binding protein [Hyphomicrobiaceae bacterium]|jgi:branched-chain amino acid transport system substrate-binding protein|nr:ABC transporter substrate-binding protein [Hyphomicrobiaceae bacterium]
MISKVLGAAFAAALTVAGLGSAQAQETLKIGGVGPLSGGGTAWGLAAQRGMEIAIEEINAAGGVKAEGKIYKLQLVMYDDQYTGAGGKAAAERLVNQDKVKFIIGPVGSPPALGVISVTNPAKVIALTNGYAPQILKNDTKDPYNFRIYPTNIEFGPPLIKWLKENAPEVKKVGMLAPNDAVGQSVAGALAEDYRKQGFEVSLELFERGIKEFTPLILRMMAQKVDAFEFDGNSPGDAGLMLKQIRQAGFKGKVIQIGGPGSDEIIEIAGAAAEGFLSYGVFDWDTPAGKKLRPIYEQKYGKGIINQFMPAFYHTVFLLVDAIKRAGSTDTDKVRDALDAMNGFDAGVYGPVKWAGKDSYGVNRQLMFTYYLAEVKDGKLVTKAKFVP